MIVLNQSRRDGEWIVASTSPGDLDAFFGSFTKRRSVRVVQIPVVKSEPDQSEQTTLLQIVRLVAQLSNARIDLSAASIVEARISTPEVEDPWADHLRKTSSESRITLKQLCRFKNGERNEQMANGESIVLSESELSLEGRLSSRSKVIDSIDGSFRQDERGFDNIDNSFQLPPSVERRLGADGIDLDAPTSPTSPETNRLSILAATSISPGFSSFQSIASKDPALSELSITNSPGCIENRVVASESATSGYVSSLFHTSGVEKGNSVVEPSSSRLFFAQRVDDSASSSGIFEKGVHSSGDQLDFLSVAASAGGESPDLSSRQRFLSGTLSEISVISLQSEGVVAESPGGKLDKNRDVEFSQEEIPPMDSNFTFDESQIGDEETPRDDTGLAFRDDADLASRDDADLASRGGSQVSLLSSSDFSYFSCQGEEMAEGESRDVPQDDDSGQSIASTFIPPSTPSLISVARRNIRVEKVSHLQYRCQWCKIAFNRAADCYHHFLVDHSKRKKNSNCTHCTKCNFRSDSRDDLGHHFRIRHEYACQFCGEVPGSFFQPTDAKSSTAKQRGGRLAVKRHEECRQHVKNYRCLLCAKRFHYLVNLKAHARGCHESYT